MASASSSASSNEASASTSAKPENCGIRDVWANNLKEEFEIIGNVVKQHNYVALKVLFSGDVTRPVGKNVPDSDYQMMRKDVDTSRIIQLGLTFMDENGNTPVGGYKAWQFNVKFNLEKDPHSKDAISILKDAGIEFDKLNDQGINLWELKYYLSLYEVARTSKTKWVGFDPGYDFAFLFKILREVDGLPPELDSFIDVLNVDIPHIYDVKYITTESCETLEGDLERVAEQLELERVGPKHQAGSEALLAGMAFFKIKEKFFEDTIDDSKFSGRISGLLIQRH